MATSRASVICEGFKVCSPSGSEKGPGVVGLGAAFEGVEFGQGRGVLVGVREAGQGVDPRGAVSCSAGLRAANSSGVIPSGA